VVLHRQAELSQMACALGAPGGFAGRLDRRQQEGHQHADDPDHHQQLDDREAVVPAVPAEPWQW